MQEQIYKELGGATKVVVFGVEHSVCFDPLEDLIGVIKMDKEIDIEQILHEKGFENRLTRYF